jgi:hypothetical protein
MPFGFPSEKAFSFAEIPTRHGLLAETVVLEAELTGRFLALLQELEEEHQPRTWTRNQCWWKPSP